MVSSTGESNSSSPKTPSGFQQSDILETDTNTWKFQNAKEIRLKTKTKNTVEQKKANAKQLK